MSLDRVLCLSGAVGSSVHDLTIQIPDWAKTDFRGLLAANTARNIDIVATPDQKAHVIGALLIDRGVLEDSTVTLSTEQDTTGVLIGSSQADESKAVRGSTIAAK